MSQAITTNIFSIYGKYCQGEGSQQAGRISVKNYDILYYTYVIVI